ncbi:3-ketoacyl-ACP reductase [Chelativorans salis]|uniref:3-ketoacyl-ACP reductase n=1 Tax=Chelativorans salis TaxID=2978478 RepID=A0ABT2LS61_9HYPH|nr:3-ketoacyl-ACP reductase [Chelativorans sp. EGI FJ00035]MCT7377366.1 3-ketoacyl-ACP reductase [Chelativorans sp. EGI FJ00035]
MSRPAAIVTGGLRGIGRVIAEALAAEGFDLTVTDVREKGVAEVRAAVEACGAGFAFHQADISDLADHPKLVEAALGAFGRIDCLVNNAGIASPARGDLLDLKPENFDRVMAVNLRGTVFLTQAVVKAMLKRSAGHPRSIVNITSVSAEMASPERADYCMSKAGLAMWTRNLALRLADENIAVFEVRPGIIRTEMTAGVAEKYDRLIAEGLVPARRWGEPEDVGRAVAGLATGRFGFATGTVVNLDGALSVPRL